MAGFITGLGIEVFTNQVRKILAAPHGTEAATGVLAAAEHLKEAMATSVDTEGYFVEVIALVQSLPHANLYSVAIGVSAFLIVRLMKRYLPRIPGALVALVLLTAVVALLDLPAKGVGVLGAIPSGLPTLTLPVIPAADYLRLLPGALAIVAILLCEGLLVVRSYANKYGYKADGDQMLFAYGAANVAAGFTGSLVTGNSPSRSAAMDASGARSQLPSLVAAVTIAIVLLFFTDLLAFLPTAALAGIVANAVLSLIEVHELEELWHMRRSEFWIAAVCLLGVLALGPLRAVAIAFLLSTIDVIRRAASPETSALTQATDGSHFVALGQTGAGFRAARARALPLRRPALLREHHPLPRGRRAAGHPGGDTRALVRAGRGGHRRRRHDGRRGAAAGHRAAGRKGHHVRRQPRRPALPGLAREVRADGARRPGPVLSDQQARGGGVPGGNVMKAITVEPGQAGTARFEEIPEPDPREGSVLVEAVAVGVCGTDVEIAEGKYGWAPPGHSRLVLGHESLGPGPRPRAERRAEEGRPRGRHRPPTGPRALPQLRGRRVGHVPQRPVHRAGDQGDPRVHVGALAHRARVRDQGGRLARDPRRAPRADDRDHEGAGAGRDGRPALLLGSGDGARDRRRPDRSPGGLRSEAVRQGGPRPRPRRDRPEAGPRAGPRRDLPLRERRGPAASSRTRSSSARGSAR